MIHPRSIRRLLLTTLVLAVALPAAADLREQVETQASDAAVAAVALPDRFEVLASRFAGADPVPAGVTPTLVLIETKGPNLSGIVRVTFRIDAAGRPLGVARASVRGRVMGPALVARSVLRYGEAIAHGEVLVEEHDLTRLRGLPLRGSADLAGRAAARTLSPGRILTDDLLRPATAVRRGETVAMAVRRRGLLVTLRTTVLKDGAPGDRIPVRNLATGARMVGEVLADGSLVLVEHASRSNR
jgi:flagella basal body P-ring formation protein FlgA